jgi:hypothetical protein
MASKEMHGSSKARSQSVSGQELGPVSGLSHVRTDLRIEEDNPSTRLTLVKNQA